VQIVAVDATGDTMHRMRWPAEQLAKQAPTWTVINVDATSPARHFLARRADLLIVYQSHDQSILSVIEERRTVAKQPSRIQRQFLRTPSASPIFRDWSSPLVWQTYERFMDLSDGVIVTGPGLHDLFKDRTDRPRFILENQMPYTPRPLARFQTHR